MLVLKKILRKRSQKWNFATNNIDYVFVFFYDQVLFL